VKELLNQNSTGYSIMPSAVNQPLLNAA
jgi:hypothetical protein